MDGDGPADPAGGSCDNGHPAFEWWQARMIRGRGCHEIAMSVHVPKPVRPYEFVLMMYYEGKTSLYNVLRREWLLEYPYEIKIEITSYQNKRNYFSYLHMCLYGQSLKGSPSL